MGWIPPVKIIDEIHCKNTPDQQAASGFSVSVPASLGFKWEDLILCVGRTQMLGTAHSSLAPEERSRLVRDVSVAILTHLNIFIDPSSARLAFTKLLDELADEERTSLASKAGAAIADLLMEKSGFRFRANARELHFGKLSGLVSRKIPDFIYDDAKGDQATQSQVVVVEAKGSLSKFLATKGRLIARAVKAYDEQVRQFVGKKANGITVSGGCAAAFGAIPGQTISRLVVCSSDVTVGKPRVATPSLAMGGFSLNVARSLSAAASAMQPMPRPQVQQQHRQEVLQPNPSGGRGGRLDHGHGGGHERQPGPNGRIAFANYETIFRLCGATNAGQAIRYCLAGVAAPVDLPQLQIFMVSATDDRFLFGNSPFAPCWSPGYFAVYRPTAEAILKSLANNRLSPPTSVTVPEIPDDLASDEQPIFVHQDGLVWVNDWKRPLVSWKWNLSAGGW